ncbi:hypothetical protein C0J52_06824 [Blattella germanica]|nr:hypothetical protein C0J52_06824 [Blattella germanica]
MSHVCVTLTPPELMQAATLTQCNETTAREDMVVIKKNIEFIMDFLSNKLDAKIEDKIIQHIQKTPPERDTISKRNHAGTLTRKERRIDTRRATLNHMSEIEEDLNNGNEDSHKQQENTWKDVIYKRSRRNATLIGTKESAELQAEEK